MSEHIDLTGCKFGMLTVTKQAPDKIVGKDNRRKKAWYCDCDCGTKNFITTTDKLRLKSQKYKSCGCLSRKNQFKNNPNKYKICGDYTIFYTHNNKEFYVDTEDIELVRKYTWCISKGYVVDRNGVLLHRLLTNAPKDKDVDHINHNKLDNRKCNLRIVFDYQNMWNQRLAKNNTSGATGVNFNKQNNKWIARIAVNCKEIYLGSFDTFEDAFKARKEAEEKYYGEYSYNNSMKEGEKYGNLSYIS